MKNKKEIWWTAKDGRTLIPFLTGRTRKEVKQNCFEHLGLPNWEACKEYYQIVKIEVKELK